MTKKATNGEFVSRWGDPDMDDSQYVTLPGFVLRNYHRLGLSADEFQVMAHIMSFKYDAPGAQARPSLATIAQQVGRSVSSVRRTVHRLETERKVLTITPQSGRPSIYDFGEMIRQCREYEQQARVDATPSVDASTGVDARPTPSVDASTGVDARPTPSVDASTPLASTLAEDIEIKVEYKIEKSGAPVPAPQPLVALVDAYWQGLPAPPARKAYGQHMKAAKVLHDAGYTPEQVLAYVRAMYQDEYWRGKVMSLWQVADKMPTWLASQKPPVPDDPRGPTVTEAQWTVINAEREKAVSHG